MSDLNSPGANAVTSAVSWLEGTLLGTIATAIAVIAIAIASVGFLMLTGRIDVRRAWQVLCGCFIIFGASTIAQGIKAAASGAGARTELAQAPPPAVLPQTPANPKSNATPYDPYAGAALPPR
jgi:type IV secretory pathway VirB2 component (pilin)